MTLQEAVDHLYQIAVVEGKATSTKRLDGLAQFCVAELARRGLDGAVTETKLPGGGREKSWDVAWSMDDKPRLAISLKSLLKNLGGTVPNRVDDLIGEVTNEASLFVEVDFSEGPRLVSGDADATPFFDRLVADVRRRNPVLERAR
ncbi:MAG: hypothetical protein OXI71_09800 [Gemmatimonadota bacterium]|nr:hypothetical protein [Gemmatimonadota bacterium]